MNSIKFVVIVTVSLPLSDINIGNDNNKYVELKIFQRQRKQIIIVVMVTIYR